MRKLLMVMAVIMAVVMAAGMASAKLLGIGSLGYPDIIFDNTGTISYRASSNSFILDADDLKIAYADGSSNSLTGGTWPLNYVTDFKIYLTIDEDGNLVGTGTMEEKVVKGAVKVKNKIYWRGTTLLKGTVTAFGWGEGNNLGDFDFLISKDSLSGALVEDGIWPNDRPTGIVAHAEKLHGWSGSWECDFTLEKVKGDKAPMVPIPSTILLLGSGLLGFGLLSRRKKVNT